MTPEDDPIIENLIESYPEWRTTTHTTRDGYEVMMIEFTDNDGTWTRGLPGKFCQMVAEHEREQP